ncbi:hypothetical protein FRACA_3290007 [Frankia canadensis]|uniref:Uncharacterized protein n=1 Tax=Frankia canadensis TaxID=1836972 RepID=A0A2I2KUR3_9ACTN|nr:hypothetical protein FRACA_3290007 [Frankia canadensis]SOU56688.1 hypothetical protein FRACA_3290007 [Frankia canadensis]
MWTMRAPTCLNQACTAGESNFRTSPASSREADQPALSVRLPEAQVPPPVLPPCARPPLARPGCRGTKAAQRPRLVGQRVLERASPHGADLAPLTQQRSARADRFRPRAYSQGERAADRRPRPCARSTARSASTDRSRPYSGPPHDTVAIA